MNKSLRPKAGELPTIKSSQRQVMPVLVIDLDSLPDMIAISKSTIQELVRQGDFPAPRQLSPRRVGWLLREIEAWVDSRPVSDLPPVSNSGAKKPRPKTCCVAAPTRSGRGEA